MGAVFFLLLIGQFLMLIRLIRRGAGNRNRIPMGDDDDSLPVANQRRLDRINAKKTIKLNP